MAEQLRAIPGVGYVWGATGLTNTPASSPQKEVEHVVLGSYDDFMMEKSRDLVVAGRMADQAASSNEVMTIYNKKQPVEGWRYRLYKRKRPYHCGGFFGGNVPG